MSAQALPKNGQPSSSKSGSSNSNSNSNNYRSKAPPRLHAAKTANEKPDISIPQARRIAVDTTGAQIVQEESPAVRMRQFLGSELWMEQLDRDVVRMGCVCVC